MADVVKIFFTDRMKNAIIGFAASGDSKMLQNVKDVSRNHREAQIIRFDEFMKILEKVRLEDRSQPYYLHELLAGSGIYEEPPKVPQKSPELIQRLKRLQAEQEQKEYDSMVRNIKSENNKSIGEEFGSAVRSTSQQMVSIVNFLITVFGCAFFAFFASQYAWDNLALRVIFAVVVGCIVAVADLYFMARTEI